MKNVQILGTWELAKWERREKNGRTCKKVAGFKVGFKSCERFWGLQEVLADINRVRGGWGCMMDPDNFSDNGNERDISAAEEVLKRVSSQSGSRTW